MRSGSKFSRLSSIAALVVIVTMIGMAGSSAAGGMAATPKSTLKPVATRIPPTRATVGQTGALPPCPQTIIPVPVLAATANATLGATKAPTTAATAAATALSTSNMKVGPFKTGGGCVLFAGLTGINEVPKPGATNGKGVATLIIARTITGPGQICFKITASGITLPASLAHIHAGPEGVAGPVIIPLAPPDANGAASGCTTGIDRSLIQGLLSHPLDYYVNVHTSDFPDGAIRGQLAPPNTAGLPSISFKQAQKEITFNSCPPEGDGGDPVLNKNKNRVDEGNFQPTAFSGISSLRWPQETERTDHAKWSPAAQAQIARAEGLPVAVEGYIALAREEGPETPNCHSATDHDFHIWFLNFPGGEANRAGAIVIEATPRVLANHPGWTVSRINAVAKAHTKVRISGWLMLDPEHPDQVGKTRGTIWEIHPIMQIDVQQGKNWVPLDTYQPGP